MNLEDAYLQIADRSLRTSEASLAASIPESAAFHAYHAFESVGGAFCSSFGEDYPTSHQRKVNQFVAVANRSTMRHRIGHNVAYVAILVGSIRNNCLYPIEVTDSDYQTPSDLIDNVDAQDLLRRVGGIVRSVQRQI